jgi:nitrite reductase (NO-forming)
VTFRQAAIVGMMTCGIAAGGCARHGAAAAAGGSTPLATEGMPPLAGQQQTCAGPRQKTFALEVREATVDLGMGTRFQAWTYDGHLPAPTIEACEGDEVTITVANHASTSHGMDSHALRMDSDHFGPVAPARTLTLHRVLDTPGVFMYHCAAGPVTDLHIKSGLAGAMVVYPRSEALRPARELVIVQSAIYGDRDPSGLVPGTNPARATKNDPTFVMFNGRLEHQPIAVAPGDLVRAYFVNVGPGVSSVHVMGTILDRVTDGARKTDSVQTYGIPAGSGATVEFRIPEAGMFGLVDHDRLGYIPTGLMLSFTAAGARHGTM